VQHYYDLTVAALKRGDKAQASKMFGLMSHYYADICQPMHTQESALETLDMHGNYEAAVDNRLYNIRSHANWVKSDGYQYVSNPWQFTVSTAIKSHAYYSSLTKNYAYHGYNSTVSKITIIELNRAVNGLSDLIVSAQYDADNVQPHIDSVSPSSATTDRPVTFSGHGTDPHHKIIGWQWRSSIDGVLSTSRTFTTTGMSVGIHTIYFRVECSSGKWCKEVSIPLVVGAAGTHPLPVYRFVNRKTGGHLMTASEAEKNNVIAKMSSTYAFEGIAYAVDASSSVNNAPLYRFLNFKRGGNFYTAIDSERDAVLARTNTYRYEGIGWNVSLSPTDTAPVYRLLNVKTLLYFWTASDAEKNSLIAQKKTYRFEGIAYYYAPPW
jgi:hypothetical protein